MIAGYNLEGSCVEQLVQEMNLLHPDLYPIDFAEELISYYDTFYDYPVSEELAEAMMEGDEMRAAKVSVSAE